MNRKGTALLMACTLWEWKRRGGKGGGRGTGREGQERERGVKTLCRLDPSVQESAPGLHVKSRTPPLPRPLTDESSETQRACVPRWPVCDVIRTADQDCHAAPSLKPSGRLGPSLPGSLWIPDLFE